MRFRLNDLLFWRRKVQDHDGELSPRIYDMRAINDRVHTATMRTGKTRAQLAELFGLDTDIPMCKQPQEKLPPPTMGTIAKVAQFLGVSVRWILTGEAENDVDTLMASVYPGHVGVAMHADVSGPAVLQKNNNCSTVIVKNIQGEYLSDQEREMILAFRKLRAADQAVVISTVFSMQQ